jgi:uncharacterized membrane protein YhiD involved in acid resistance
MKKRLITLFLINLLIASMLVATPTNAQSDDETGESTYSESFDTGLLSGWERSSDVAVTNGVLKIDPGNFALKMGHWENPTISLKVKYAKPGEVNIHYHMGEGYTYVIHIMEDALILDKVEKEQPTQLGVGTLTGVQAGSWMTLDISFDGSTHKISVNNTEVITATDSSPLKGGGFLVSVMGESAGEFDSLSIKGKMGTGAEDETEEQPAESAPETTTTTKPSVPKITGSTNGASVGTIQEEGLKSYITQFFYDKRADTKMSTFIINLLLATVFAFILGKAYIYWGSSLSNRRRFAANFMLMTITTTFIIMVVRSSVALSLGLVGALSIVRFRTAVKEPEELAYLFMAIAIGIGLGDNQRLLTLFALAVTITIIGLVRTFRKSHADANLHLTVASHSPHKISLDNITNVLKKHCSKLKLLRCDEDGRSVEMSFMLEFKRITDLNKTKEALHELSPSIHVTFLDNKGIW